MFTFSYAFSPEEAEILTEADLTSFVACSVTKGEQGKTTMSLDDAADSQKHLMQQGKLIKVILMEVQLKLRKMVNIS